MMPIKWRQPALHGFGWGCVAGLALVAVMYVANLVLGLRPLPQLLNEPLLSLMPGWMFGFLIDTLQHAGKVVEEAGLIVGMVVGLGVLGAATSVAALRWSSRYLPFIFAGAAWIVVVVALLPAGGLGLLGLNDGPATPIMWAALFATYAVVLQMGAQAPAYDQGRRQLLSTVPITIAAISLGVLALRLLPDWYRAVFTPPESGLSGPSPALTPVQNFYYVSKNIGADPNIDGQAWRLAVGGLADKPLKLSLGELRALPKTTELVTLQCISNDVGGLLMSTGSFGGVKLSELLTQASPQPSASWVGFKARDGYSESLPMSLVAGAPEILVAYELNGAPLPISHGYPARILIPGHYGMKGPKWLESIELVNHEAGGYWEQQGWDHNAVVKTTARFDVPHKGEIIKRGTIALAGVAFAGIRGISKVEYSVDNGARWSEATFDPPLSPLTWVIWRASWTPSSEGSYTLKVRATDGTGKLQDKTDAGSYPSGASGYHTIQVSVSK
jgi:DMSO/TMAO reductase YedYZ molybdopterin-dependent catalytic subunit